jgi:hypothetical protein
MSGGVANMENQESINNEVKRTLSHLLEIQDVNHPPVRSPQQFINHQGGHDYIHK